MLGRRVCYSLLGAAIAAMVDRKSGARDRQTPLSLDGITIQQWPRPVTVKFVNFYREKFLLQKDRISGTNRAFEWYCQEWKLDYFRVKIVFNFVHLDFHLPVAICVFKGVSKTIASLSNKITF